MNIQDEIYAARQRVRRDREGALANLNELFRQGALPDPSLHGRYRGELVTTSLSRLLDWKARAFTRIWLPWQGKTFDSNAATGDNIFSNNGYWLSRLIWPSYRGVVPDGAGRSRACQFRTFTAAGKLDPDRQVLKIDYDIEANPGFLLRDVLDELVQVGEGLYLGKALLRRPEERWICAAYFTLRSE